MQHPFRAEVACFSAASDKDNKSESGALHYKVLAFMVKKGGDRCNATAVENEFPSSSNRRLLLIGVGIST
jgi:hypothetical protein